MWAFQNNYLVYVCMGFPSGSGVNNLLAMRETWVWFLGREDPLKKEMATHFSVIIWKNPMDRGAWRATIQRVAKGWTRLSDFPFTFQFHTLEDMATHSSVFAWRIPGTKEPGGLPSMGSHRVGHDWPGLAVARELCQYMKICYTLIWKNMDKFSWITTALETYIS